MAENLENERDLKQEIVNLLNQATAARQDELSVSNALVESIKEALGITRGRNATDAGLLNVNREINRSILNQKEGLTDVGALQKVIAKKEIKGNNILSYPYCIEYRARDSASITYRLIRCLYLRKAC